MKTIKKFTKRELWAGAFLITLNILLGTSVIAQNAMPEKIDVTIHNDASSSAWFTQPWVWVVGVALFIVVIIAITQSSRREA